MFVCLRFIFFWFLFIVRLCFVLMRNEIKRTSAFNGDSGPASFKYFSSPTSFRTQRDDVNSICMSLPGFGLRCHRAIKEIAILIGIEDMRCKVYGETNPISLVRAVFQGLLSQVNFYRRASRRE